MKKIVLIVLGVLLSAAFICTQITDTKELRFTLRVVNCAVISDQIIYEEFEQLEALDVKFDARYSKRILGSAKAEGEVTFDGKIYQIREIQPTDKGWTLILWHEGDPPTKCAYLSTTPNFDRFNLMYRESLWYGPADDPDSLVGSLAAFGLLL